MGIPLYVNILIPHRSPAITPIYTNISQNVILHSSNLSNKVGTVSHRIYKQNSMTQSITVSQPISMVYHRKQCARSWKIIILFNFESGHPGLVSRAMNLEHRVSGSVPTIFRCIQLITDRYSKSYMDTEICARF
jgi:hypothetical protein